MGRPNVRIDHACMIVARGALLKFWPLRAHLACYVIIPPHDAYNLAYSPMRSKLLVGYSFSVMVKNELYSYHNYVV